MPFGYMPAKADDGAFILRICDGTMEPPQGTPEQAMHGEMHHAEMDHGDRHSSHANHDDTSHESRCNYAVTVAANLPESPAVVHREQSRIVIPSPRLAVLTAIYPPNLPPATGPPEL